MPRSHRWGAGLLTAGLVLTLLPATGAHAGPEGRRNTALAATAAAGVLIYRYAQKPSTQRLLPAAAAAGAAGYLWYNDGKKREAEKKAQRARYARRVAVQRARYATKHKRACR